MQQQTQPEKNRDDLVAWVEECLSVAKQKASALTQNNLAALEQCLEQEAQLLARRPVIRKGTGSIPRSLISGLRAANRTNRALIANGLELSRTLIDTIHPPATYSVTPWGTSPRPPIEPAISVEC